MDAIRQKPYIVHSLYNVYALANNNFLAIPKSLHDEYELYVGFPTIDLKKASTEDKQTEVRKLADLLSKINNHAIYLLCNINKEMIAEFAIYNDTKIGLYGALREKTYEYLQNAYNFLDKYNYKIKLPINVVKQNNDDTKLIDWFEVNYSKLIKGIKYEKLKSIYNELIFSGTMALPFLKTPKPEKTKVKVRRRNHYGYTKIYLLLTLAISLIFGIEIAYLLIK